MTLPKKVCVANVVELVQGGQVVARAHAEFDLTEVPEQYQGFVLPLLERRTQLLIRSEERMLESEKWLRRYEQRKADYWAKPWWRRIFASRP